MHILKKKREPIFYRLFVSIKCFKEGHGKLFGWLSLFLASGRDKEKRLEVVNLFKTKVYRVSNRVFSAPLLFLSTIFCHFARLAIRN